MSSAFYSAVADKRNTQECEGIWLKTQDLDSCGPLCHTSVKLCVTKIFPSILHQCCLVRCPKSTAMPTLKQHLATFCREACIHGPSYIVSSRNHVEHVWWIFIIAFSAISGSYLVITAVMEWADNPLTKKVLNDRVPIEQILYPSVTICSKKVSK